MGLNINETPKEKSTGHSNSSSVLIMLVSVVVPEKLPEQISSSATTEELRDTLSK